MNTKNTPLFIIGAVIVIGIVGVLAYALMRPSGTTSQQPTTGSEASQPQQTAPAATTDQVTIQNYAFSPSAITVKVGTKVTWTNKDTVEHTVTTDTGTPTAVDSGLFGNGKSFSYTFTKAGTYSYYCQPHPYMKGTVTVTQ